jgi:leader peptidase (prepilin peptidase) / N-methyltransferase
MVWLIQLPMIACVVWVFVLGLGIGSFLNVLIARMPFDKSVIWPGSRCGACHRPLAFRDNLPIIGYLLLRGKCRMCGTQFSSSYLWVELGTGVLFVGVFVLEILNNWHRIPGLQNPGAGIGGLPTFSLWVYFASHAFLLSMLLVSSIIDYHYRIIPGHLTYFGTVVGILVSTMFPWPFPSDVASISPPVLVNGWADPRLTNLIPTGLALWPFWGPPPSWAPAGSWQLGLCTGLIGAAVGQIVGRSVKWLFEIGFGNEALGLGDADLMMMIGSFLGWQITFLALPAGSFVLLPIVLGGAVLRFFLRTVRGTPPPAITDQGAMPFGPGIAAGAVACWLAWPTLGEAGRVFYFSPEVLLFSIVIGGGGLLVCGVILRRAPVEEIVSPETTSP